MQKQISAADMKTFRSILLDSSLEIHSTPPCSPFNIHTIYSLRLQFTNLSEISHFCFLPNLTHIQIDNVCSKDYNPTLSLLSLFPNLTHLSLLIQPSQLNNPIPPHLSLLQLQISNLSSPLLTYSSYYSFFSKLSKTFPNLISFGTLSFYSFQHYPFLLALTKLQQIKIKDMVFLKNDGDFQNFTTKLFHITSFIFDQYEFEEGAFEELCKEVKVIKRLSMKCTKIGDDALKCLREYHSETLTSLRLDYNNSLKGTEFTETIRYFHHLKQLYISSSCLSLDLLITLSNNLLELQKLSINDYKQTPQIPQSILDLTQNAPLISLLPIRNLPLYLSVILNDLTVKTLPSLFPSIKSLKLFDNFFWTDPENVYRITNQGYYYVSRLKELERLRVQGGALKERGVMKVMRNLKGMNVKIYWNGQAPGNYKGDSKVRRNLKVFQAARHSIVDLR